MLKQLGQKTLARKRLQELFKKYDTSGDGVLSEDEMVKIFAHLSVPEEETRKMLKAADSNEDGLIQVHEFISWLTQMPPQYVVEEKGDEVEITMTNTSDSHAQSFIVLVRNFENVELLLGKMSTVVLKPGEQVTKKLLKLQPAHRYSVKVSMRHEAEKGAGAVAAQELWKDPDFLHDDSSIQNGKEKINGKPESWLPARELGDPKTAVLVDQLKPEDVQQGLVGDCALLSAIAALGKHPKKVKSLFQEQQLTDDGKYGIWLCDPKSKKWNLVHVDEFIPLYTDPKDSVVKPCFVRPLSEELWVMLLEKAMAKWCGSYAGLNMGDPCWYLAALTGELSVRYARKPGSRSWKKIKPRDSSIQSRCPKGLVWRSAQWGMTSEDTIWKKLCENIAQKHVITCVISSQEGGLEAKLSQGLYNRHCYSLLRAFEETLDNGQPIRFVQLRNPWGHGEWEGDWSDFGWGALSMGRLRSKRWQENPKLRDRLAVGLKDDGIFYMSFEDWANIYSYVDICPVGGAPIPPDPDDEDGEDHEDQGGILSFFGW